MFLFENVIKATHTEKQQNNCHSFYEGETEGSHLGERSILVLFTY